jgi:hypothetical protein
VTLQQFKWLIQSIFAVRNKEMLCSEFFEIVPRYVDRQELGHAVIRKLKKQSKIPASYSGGWFDGSAIAARLLL